MATESVEIEAGGQFGSLLKDLMNEQGLSAVALSVRAETTYENVRKMINGKSHPSPKLRERLAKVLKTSTKELSEVIDAEKIRKHYKQLPESLATPIPPEVEPFLIPLRRLSPEHRETVLAMIKTLQRQEHSR